MGCVTYDAMMAEIDGGAFIPADATAFFVEFICRRFAAGLKQGRPKPAGVIDG
jgi:hypothetical protein